MALSDITNPEAVEAALRDFDSLGRDKFLQRYEFEPAKRYFLTRNGCRYDCTAILGVAHGYQHPEWGPLKPGRLLAREQDVARILRALGFEVLQLGKLRHPQKWALCAKPTRYRIMEAVTHLVFDYWTIGRSDIRAGDQAIVWQTLDNQGLRGVVAFAEVLSDPENIPDPNPYWNDPSDGTAVEARVRVAYAVPPGLPLWIDDSEVGQFLKSLSVARTQGGTAFHITPEQWDRLTTIAAYERTSHDVIEAEQVLRRLSTGGGQGFGLTAGERKAVEEHAMSTAMKFLKGEWESVENVCDRCSYDLHCSRPGEQLRVEVKGTTGDGTQIVLTRNEVREAEAAGYALLIVSEIKLNTSDGAPKASGGLARYFYPWTPLPDALSPISYRCSIDFAAGVLINSTEMSKDV